MTKIKQSPDFFEKKKCRIKILKNIHQFSVCQIATSVFDSFEWFLWVWFDRTDSEKISKYWKSSDSTRPN